MRRPAATPKSRPRRAAAKPARPTPRDLTHPSFYINRELSWLEFNDRVLLQARDASHPLLERVKFLSIVATNLDEFYMIRVATTVKRIKSGIENPAPDGLGATQELAAMRARAGQMLRDVNDVWAQLRDLLQREGVDVLEIADWTTEIRDYLAEHFTREIGPVLTPLAFDPGHPFPFISNLSMNFAVVVRHGGRIKFARVKVPDVLPRFLQVPADLLPEGRQGFVFIEDAVRENLQELFPGTQIRGAHLFRIVRDADLEVEANEADDLLETVESNLRELRHGAISLLHVEAQMPRRVLSILEENFQSEEGVVVRTGDRLGFADWRELTKMARPALKDPPFAPRVLWRADEDPEVLFQDLLDHDRLVHHPFESFSAVEAFVRAAATDPHVIAIKMTLYRIGQNSPLVDLLIEAAEGGKQVAVLVELKARFDERNNIIWARRLEEAGVHVVYGWVDVKTHCKLCLVVRKEADGIRRYVHTGTGNYNADTAKVYTDVGLFTTDADVVADVSEVFNYLTGYSHQREFRQLLVAPSQLRARLTELIERETTHARAGRSGRIILKMNAVTDDKIIRALYRASQAGVRVEMVVRGICCLRPGIPRVSDNIHVRSIIGRFLEHSRLFWFQNGGEDELFIGSADLMERNLVRRVEVLCPVKDAEQRAYLRDVVLDAYLRDSARALTLDREGRYSRAARSVNGPFDAQSCLLEHHGQQAGD